MNCKLQEYGSVKPMVPFNPESGVQLSINARMIMRQLGAAIHNQQHLAPLHLYYCTHFRWDPHCFDGINWPTYMLWFPNAFLVTALFLQQIWLEEVTGEDY
jgi:hypothetical protein